MENSNSQEIAVLGAGCFWCVETIYMRLNGVLKVESGYSGGHLQNPTYKEVCTGTTGHAEVCQITFDPILISFEKILNVFWKIHDPTTPNRQGNDIGPQYRSVIFYTNETQKVQAENLKLYLNNKQAFYQPIITEISPFHHFYPAEDYHTNYFNQHGEEPYCRIVVKPKVEKFENLFSEWLKEKK